MSKTVKGLERVLKKLNDLEKDLDKYVEAEVAAAARYTAGVAKGFAPVDTGKLQQSISYAKEGPLTYKVYASVPYAAYVEFGTGGLVQVPPELQEIAIKFKGRGVKKINLRPQPYMFPALQYGRIELLERLEDLLQKEMDEI